MAQTGYTPILCYASGTPGNTPSASNMTSSASGAELAINYADGKLFYKDSSGTVQVLAVKMPSGILPIANGGTNATAVPTAGAVAYGTGTAYAFTSAGTSNQVLISNGSSAPSWSNLSSLGVTSLSFGTTGLTPSTATQGAITVAGTLATTNGGTGLTSFTANGVIYASSTSALTSGSALTFDGTNLGIGVTPSTFGVSYKAAQVGAGATLMGVASGDGAYLMTNASFDGTNFKYVANDTASSYVQIGSQHIWSYAGSGTAGNNITFTESMRLTSTGLGIGTSSPGEKLDVVGTVQSNGVFSVNGTTTGSASKVWFGSDGGGGGFINVPSSKSLNIYQNNATLVAQFNASGNLGLGVTPSASTSGTYKGLYVGHTLVKGAPSAATASFASNCDIANNYIYTGYASRYDQGGGAHYWYTAPSGTAGNAISFTQAMTLTAAGRLGIGTTSPAALLDVSGGSNSNGSITVSSTGSTAGSFSSMNFTTGTGTWSIGQEGNGRFFVYDGSADRLVFSAGGANSSTTLTARGTGAFIVTTNDAERARIDSSGNFGIGTSSPAYKLDVNGQARTKGTFWVDRSSTSANAIVNWSTNGTYDWQLYTTGSATPSLSFYQSGVGDRMTLDSSGNLGLGVTPSAWSTNDTALQIRNGAGIAVSATPNLSLFRNSYESATGWKYYANGYAGLFNLESDGAFKFFTAPSGTAGNAISFTQAMTLDSSGNLLVGTTSTDIAAVGIRLMNNNQVQASKSGDWSFRMGRRDSTGIITEIYYNSSRVGDIATNGSSTSYNTSSDYRLKENIAPMTGALAKVAALNPVTYTWKVDGSDGEGFIAHELAEVCPQAVTGEKDAVDADGKPVYQGIDTSFLVATLTAAIQEQQAIINDLKARLDAANL